MGLKGLTPKTLVVLGIVLLMAGCLPVGSVHPLFTEKDLVFEPALLGTWATEGDEETEETLEFRQSGDNAYNLVYTENGVPAKLRAHLVRLGEFLFLDLFPAEPEEPVEKVMNYGYFLHLRPVHTFWIIRIEGDVLHLATIDSGRIRQGMVEIHLARIHHAPFGPDDVLLTASTQELQEFLSTHAKNCDCFTAYPKTGGWRRRG